MIPTLEQRTYVLYDRILHTLAGINIANDEELKALFAILTAEAGRHADEDSVALRLMCQIVEVYHDADR